MLPDHQPCPDATNDKLLGLVQEGGTTQAALAFAEISARMREAGYSTAEINQHFRQYRDAAASATAATGPVGAGFATASQEALILNSSLQELVSTGMSLVDVFELLNGAAINYDEANLRVTEAIGTMTEALRTNGATIDQNTLAGQRNRVAIGDVVEAAVQAAQAMYEQTGSVQQANSVYQSHISQLRSVLRQMGLTEAQINDIIGAYARMPRNVTTTITTVRRTIYQTVQGQVARYSDQHGATTAYRSGGVHVPAARDGLIMGRDVSGIYHGSRGPWYRMGEPGVGREGLIPEHIPHRRAMALLSEVAGWHRATVIPRDHANATSGGAGPRVTARSGWTRTGSDEHMIRLLVRALERVTVTMDGGRVGAVQGRRADLLTRGG